MSRANPRSKDEAFASIDLMTWARWLEGPDSKRVVAQTKLPNGKFVSTVFIGLDHSFGGLKPLLFETMIFGTGDEDEYQERYSTYEEAEAGHAKAVELAGGKGL